MEINVSYPLPLNTSEYNIDSNSKKKKVQHLPITFNKIDTMIVEDVFYVVYATNQFLKLTPVKHGEMYFVIDEEQPELTIDLENTDVLVQIAVNGNLIALCYHSAIEVYEVEIGSDEDVNMSDDFNSAAGKKPLSLTRIRKYKNKVDSFMKMIFIGNREFFAIDNLNLKLFNVKHKKAVKEIDISSLKVIDFEVISAGEWLVLSRRTLYRLRIAEDESVTVEVITKCVFHLGFFWKLLLSKHSPTVAHIVTKRAVLAVKTDEKRNTGTKSHLNKIFYSTGRLNDPLVTSERCGNCEYILISSVEKNEPTILLVFDYETKAFQCQTTINTLSDHFYNTIVLKGKCQDFRSELKNRFRLPNAGIKIVISQKCEKKISVCLLIVNSIGDITHQYVSKNLNNLLYDRKFSIQEYAKWDEAIVKNVPSHIEVDQMNGPNNVDLLKRIIKTKIKSLI